MIPFNHCVTNYYRPLTNYLIDHHSGKDLDLHKSGVIVSLSIGEELTLELKRWGRHVGDNGVERVKVETPSRERIGDGTEDEPGVYALNSRPGQ